jgi:hypothetical protein
MDCTMRPALDDDAADIGAVILRALRETNAKDYTDEIICLERASNSRTNAAATVA